MVQPFYLPKYQHGTYQPAGVSGAALKLGVGNFESSGPSPLTMETVGEDENEDIEEAAPAVARPDLPIHGIPKTMRELAEAAAKEEPPFQEPPAPDGPRHPPHVLDPNTSQNGRALRPPRCQSGTPSTRNTTPVAPARVSARRTGRKRARGARSSSRSSSGGDGGADEDAPTPSKRGKAVAVAPTTRVLRSRAPKNAETLRKEREAEAAFRRAVAE